MFTLDRRSLEAQERGKEAFTDGLPLTKNPYLNLGSRYQVLASHWDLGWYEAERAKSVQDNKQEV